MTVKLALVAFEREGDILIKAGSSGPHRGRTRHLHLAEHV